MKESCFCYWVGVGERRRVLLSPMVYSLPGADTDCVKSFILFYWFVWLGKWLLMLPGGANGENFVGRFASCRVEVLGYFHVSGSHLLSHPPTCLFGIISNQHGRLLGKVDVPILGILHHEDPLLIHTGLTFNFFDPLC